MESLENDTKAEKNHLAALDGLRGFAVLLVMIFHIVLGYPFEAGDKAFLYKLAGVGWSGVDLFFVLSGFLITGILLDNKGSTNFFKAFFGRRVLRIFPLYYGVLIVVFVILPVFGLYNTPKLQFISDHQLYFWTFSINWGFVAARGAHFFNVDWLALVHFWSLAVEEQFYLLWPFVVFFCPRNRFFKICILLVLGALAFRLMMAMLHLPNGASYTLTPARIDTLAIGALISLAVRQSSAPSGLYAAAPWCTVAAFVSMSAVFVARDGIWFSDRFVNTFGFSILAFGWGGLLVMCLPGYPNPLVRRIFSSRLLRFFGVYSYGLYVLHHLILPHLPAAPFAALQLPEFIALLLYIGVCLLVFVAAAWLSWNLYEKQFLKLKGLFVYKRERMPIALLRPKAHKSDDTALVNEVAK
jgi:peptidoglycan/LPS O-acetylase OafA/YrhL